MRGQGFAGRLTERLIVERWEDASDDLACDPGRWVDHGRVWAAVHQKVQGPATEAGALSARARWIVIVRDDAAIDMRCRLIWRGRCLMPLTFTHDLKRQCTIVTEEKPQ